MLIKPLAFAAKEIHWYWIMKTCLPELSFNLGPIFAPQTAAVHEILVFVFLIQVDGTFAVMDKFFTLSKNLKNKYGKKSELDSNGWEALGREM